MQLNLSLLVLLLASSDASSIRGRRLNNAFNTVYSQMTSYFEGGCTRNTDANDVTTVQCSRPGLTATFVARTRNTKPDYLQVCQTTNGGSCQTWYFANTDNPQSYVDQAFPLTNRDPGTDYNQVFSAMKRAYPTPAACQVTPANGRTTVVCTDPNSSATLQANGESSPTPVSLQTCAGNSPCQNWSFTNGQPVSVILAQAFPNDNRSGTDFDKVKDEMERLYPTCQTSAPNGQTLVHCSDSTGATAQLIASGTVKPIANELIVCKPVGSGHSTCNTFAFNGSQTAEQILALAFPGGSRSDSTYSQIYRAMIARYPNQCQTSTANDQTIVDCSNTTSSATLTANGTVDPVAQTFVVCTISATVKQCHQFDLTTGTTSAAAVLASAFP